MPISTHIPVLFQVLRTQYSGGLYVYSYTLPLHIPARSAIKKPRAAETFYPLRRASVFYSGDFLKETAAEDGVDFLPLFSLPSLADKVVGPGECT